MTRRPYHRQAKPNRQAPDPLAAFLFDDDLDAGPVESYIEKLLDEAASEEADESEVRRIIGPEED